MEAKWTEFELDRQSPRGYAGNGWGLYTRVFDLSPFDVEKVKITGAWAIDDTGILSLNGNVVNALGAGRWGSLTPFSVPTEFLNPGRNILTVTMLQNDVNLDAMRVEGWVIVVPEPSTWMMLVAGLALVLAAGRKAQHVI